MGRGEELTEEERKVVIYALSQGHPAFKIAKLLKRDARTIKKAIKNIEYARKPRSDKGKCMLSKSQIEQVKEVAQKHPSKTSKEIFDIAGVVGIGKSLRCSVLKDVGHVNNCFKGPSISIENISTESIKNIKAAVQLNPHLPSKDIFELAGVPDVGKTLRDQILEEVRGTKTYEVNSTNAVTNAASTTGAIATIADNTEEVTCISNVNFTIRVRLPEDDAVATGVKDSDVIIVKEELVPDVNPQDTNHLFQWQT